MPLGAFKAALMGTAGVSTTGDVVLLQTQPASDSASISFTSGIDSTYGEYIFKFYNINNATDHTDLVWQANAAGGSGYNETITSTSVTAYHNESGSDSTLAYTSAIDQTQGTAYENLTRDTGNDADANAAGELHIFNPSSTTYVKHFYSKTNSMNGDATAYCWTLLQAGYINTTSAIDEIQFKSSSGNFDGKIKLWGVK